MTHKEALEQAEQAAEHTAMDLFIRAREVYAEGDDLSAFDYARRARLILESVGIYVEGPDAPVFTTGAVGLGPQERIKA